MNLIKQDVGLWVNCLKDLPDLSDHGNIYSSRILSSEEDKEDVIAYVEMCILPDNILRFESDTMSTHTIPAHYAILKNYEWLKPIKQVYPLTEIELKKLIQESMMWVNDEDEVTDFIRKDSETFFNSITQVNKQ